MTISFLEFEYKQKTNCQITVGNYILRAKIKSIDNNFEIKKVEIVWPQLEKAAKRINFPDTEFHFDRPLNWEIEEKNLELCEALGNSKYIFVNNLRELRMLQTMMTNFPQVKIELI